MKSEAGERGQNNKTKQTIFWRSSVCLVLWFWGRPCFIFIPYFGLVWWGKYGMKIRSAKRRSRDVDETFVSDSWIFMSLTKVSSRLRLFPHHISGPPFNILCWEKKRGPTVQNIKSPEIWWGPFFIPYFPLPTRKLGPQENMV